MFLDKGSRPYCWAGSAADAELQCLSRHHQSPLASRQGFGTMPFTGVGSGDGWSLDIMLSSCSSEIRVNQDQIFVENCRPVRCRCRLPRRFRKGQDDRRGWLVNCLHTKKDSDRPLQNQTGPAKQTVAARSCSIDCACSRARSGQVHAPYIGTARRLANPWRRSRQTGCIGSSRWSAR
jgi:hypothetical protein